ncbi:MAG: hypothetical protein U5P41_16040 [Gammaproteobacteria bacterium]|nr:hypothetical protein [Gammaproteobacteria bacterium]
MTVAVATAEPDQVSVILAFNIGFADRLACGESVIPETAQRLSGVAVQSLPRHVVSRGMYRLRIKGWHPVKQLIFLNFLRTGFALMGQPFSFARPKERGERKGRPDDAHFLRYATLARRFSPRAVRARGLMCGIHAAPLRALGHSLAVPGRVIREFSVDSGFKRGQSPR